MEVRELTAASAVASIPQGARALVVSDLLLPPQITDASASTSAALAAELEAWEGPGVLVLAGNLVDPSATTDVARLVASALDAHDRLRDAIRAFCAAEGRRGFVLPGWRDAELASDAARRELALVGVEVVASVELELVTASGLRHVVVETARPAFVPAHPSTSEWMIGEEQLEDPAAAPRFLASRLRYRGLRRLAWIAPLVALVAIVVTHGGSSSPASSRARCARRSRTTSFSASCTCPGRRGSRSPWSSSSLAELVAAGTASVLAARRYPRSLRDQPRSSDPFEALDRDRAGPRPRPRAAGARVAGYVVGGSMRAALRPMAGGFLAAPGATSEVVCELPGAFGLPSVFLPRRTAGFLELEAGTEVHARLMVGDDALPGATLRGAARRASAPRAPRRDAARRPRRLVAPRPAVAGRPRRPRPAAPPAPRPSHRRARSCSPASPTSPSRCRRRLRNQLHAVLGILPIGVSQTAAALLALTGVALIMLARGVRRGQHRAWLAAILVLAVSMVGHVGRNAGVPGVVVSAAVLAFLLLRRKDFRARSDSVSLATAAPYLLIAAIAAVTGAVIGIEATNLRRGELPWLGLVIAAVIERLAGLSTVALPDRVDDFVYPAMLAVGLAIAVTVLYLATRPVVDRRLSERHTSAERRAAELRARDLVRRHGLGTLDYFALRDDKQWFFHRDTLVAYAVYGGVCLVSPDPIGPADEREEIWGAFRAFAEQRGWTMGLVGAGEAWLPLYAAAGMRYLYLGDEAVVDVQGFSLAGGKMKGLRQACTRMERHGYTVEFLDPAAIDPARVPAIVSMMQLNRRGEDERGFSMCLGRLFDPKDQGLLLALATGPAGEPAAMCQFVPSPAVRGFSLDLMRRDPGEHPNGLLDFVLCRTIEHLAAEGANGAQPQLRGVPLDPRRRARRGADDADGALGAQAALGDRADRVALALQREVRARVAASLPRLPRRGVLRPRRHGDAARRVDHRAPGHRAVPLERPCEPPGHDRAGVAAGRRPCAAMTSGARARARGAPCTGPDAPSGTIEALWSCRSRRPNRVALRRRRGPQAAPATSTHPASRSWRTSGSPRCATSSASSTHDTSRPSRHVSCPSAASRSPWSRCPTPRWPS